MASPCELRLYASSPLQAERAARAAIAEVQRIEQKYSRYRADSIVSEINAAAGGRVVSVDDETAGLLNYADAAYRESGGLFDISSGVLRRAWDFQSASLPSGALLEALLPLVGWHKVNWQAPKIALPTPGMQLDFGGFGKEYAADCAARVCKAEGIVHGLVELGGDIHALGPHPDGRAWQVGVRDPRCPERATATLALQQGGLATSGDYQRYMLVDGQRYCHILNPNTGWPQPDGFASVSVVAPLCLLAGTGATVAMLKGVAAGRQWLQDLSLAHLWVTQGGDLGGSLCPEDRVMGLASPTVE